MFSLDLSFAAILYVVTGLLLIAVLWGYYDRRDRRFYDETRRKTTFHCVKCDQVYSGTGRLETSPCPRCGHENARLHF